MSELSSGQQALLQRLANSLSEDIKFEVTDTDLTIEEVVNRVIPKGSPGSSFHRSALAGRLRDLVEVGTPLDLITCLQVCEAFDWSVGLLADDD